MFVPLAAEKRAIDEWLAALGRAAGFRNPPDVFEPKLQHAGGAGGIAHVDAAGARLLAIIGAPDEGLTAAAPPHHLRRLGALEARRLARLERAEPRGAARAGGKTLPRHDGAGEAAGSAGRQLDTGERHA